MPISCFAAGTPVLTVGGYKNIEDIEKGDLVQTHKGRFRKVLDTKKSVSKDLYSIVVNKRKTPLVVTGNHKLLSNYGWKTVDSLNTLDDLLACDYVLNIPENEYTIEIDNINTPFTQFKRTQLKEKVEVTEDLAWALGFWFAEGSVSNVGTLKVTNGSDILCNKFVSIMSKAFGLKGKTRANKTWFDGELNSKTLCEWFNNEFGRGCKEKTITDWIVFLPNNLLISFFNGFYDGDGFKTTKNKAFELANPKLVAGIHQILCKLGIRHSLQLKKFMAPTGNYHGVVIIDNVKEIRKNTAKTGVIFNGLQYNQIESLTKLDIKTDVYDIQVEDDESFVAAGVVAHNCFLQSVHDSRQGIFNHYTESGFLSSNGGGLGADWSSIRSNGMITSNGVTSTGLIPFIKVSDSMTLACSQGGSRRGAYAAYLDISHPEIEEFLIFRKPSGDPNRRCLNIHHGVNVTDRFMESVVNNLDFELRDPHTGQVTKTVSARNLWIKILELRLETGEPYIHFSDTSNRLLPKELKDLGLTINGSNLCSEIFLPTSPDRTAVCCLSSVNLAKYDEWKDDKDFIGDVIEFLDNVLEDFIDRAPKQAFWRAINSAMRERSLGLGAMGFHTFLQQKKVPFDSVVAKSWNKKIFGQIQEQAQERTKKLAKIRGEAPDMTGSGKRNAHVMAIAPNATSSYVCDGVSPGIEPTLNSFSAKTKTLNFTWRNSALEPYIKDEKVWRNIHADNGSVQNTNLSQELKDVFKTSFELDQRWIVDLAADRQKFIDQGQSINLFFTAEDDVKYINQVHMDAWKKGLKSLYYVRSQSIGRSENIADKVERTYRSDSQPTGEDECVACSG